MAIELRPEVRAFAEAMETLLSAHDARKGAGWKTTSRDELLRELDDKIQGLEVAMEYDDNAHLLRCAASVGAHAMFVANVMGALDTAGEG